MTELSEREKQRVKVYLEEFKALKAEIAANQLASRQATYLAILAVTALAGIAEGMGNGTRPELYLLAPLVFLVLQLMQLRYVHLGLAMGDYIHSRIAPGINTLLSVQATPETSAEPEPTVMEWESHPAVTMNPHFAVPAAGAAAYFPLFASILVGALFVYTKPMGSRFPWSWPTHEWAIFLVQAVILLFCVVVGVSALRSRNRVAATLTGQVKCPDGSVLPCRAKVTKDGKLVLECKFSNSFALKLFAAGKVGLVVELKDHCKVE